MEQPTSNQQLHYEKLKLFLVTHCHAFFNLLLQFFSFLISICMYLL